MSLRPRSIRVQLTLWYLCVLALILGLFAAGVYLSMRRSLQEQLDDTVENRARLVARLVAFDSEGAPSLSLGTDPVDTELDDEFQRLYGPAGELLFENHQSAGPTQLDDGVLRQALGGRTYLTTVREGGSEARVFTMPVEADGRVAAILQSGQSTADMRETLRNLRAILAIGMGAALVLASAGGFWLTTRALSPIDDITRAAQQITAQDLSRRLDADLPDDEVGRLARTFDGMIARLDGAFQQQRRFTADASHELRTPLTAVRGQIDVALSRPRDAAEYQRVLGTINAQVERMTRLTGDLLVLARADAGAAIQREPVDALQLMESVAEQIRPFAAQKGIDVGIEDAAAVQFRGDEDLLLQLLLNLADNALKHTESGAVTLGWRAAPGEVRLFVRDTGAGIAPEHLGRLFERFYRVDAGRARQDGGTGLGLAICRAIAEAHGGALGIESSNTGSTFTVTLPQT